MKRDATEILVLTLFVILLSTTIPVLGERAPGDFLIWLTTGRYAEEADPEFQKTFDLESTPWLDTKEHAGVVYFLFQDPARIERFNLRNARWLTAVPLPEEPTAFCIDDAGLYVSFGRRTSRFNLVGGGEIHLRNMSENVTDMFTISNFLYIYAADTLTSLNKNTGFYIDSEEYWYRMRDIEVAPAIWKIFSRSVGVSPSDIVEVVLNPDGTLGPQNDSRYHGDYPDARRVFLFPGDARVADNSGIIYNTNDLTYSNSLGGPFQDLAFYGDVPIVARDDALVSYSSAFLRTGQYTPERKPLRIFIHESSIFSFFEDDHGDRSIDFTEISIGLLIPEEPGTPVDPNGLNYEPDEVVIGKDEVVYILSRSFLSVFRWSVAERRYLETIPLLRAPKFMSYSEKSHRLYLAYPTGEISRIDLEITTEEAPFVNSPQEPCGLSTAGEYLFVCDPSGAWVSHFTYSPEGDLISQKDWNYYSREYVWSEVNRKMYFFRDDTSPNDLIWEEIDVHGVLGDDLDSPYHGGVGTRHPIRVAPDGTIVLLGSGRIYDAISLEHIDALSNDIDDAVWIGEHLFTLRVAGEYSQLQKWGGINYAVLAQQEAWGMPIRMFGIAEGLLVITNRSGPWFSVWDSELSSEGLAVTKDDGLATAMESSEVVYAITVTNTGSEEIRGATVADFFPPELVEASWTCTASPGSRCEDQLITGDLQDTVDLLPAGTLVYRARAIVSEGASGSTVNTVTVTSPRGVQYTATDVTEVIRADEPSCVGSSENLCLNNQRFRVEVDWRDLEGHTGVAQVVPFGSDDSGLFWFFAPDNWEMLVKVLDGCGLNMHFWVFCAATTNVEYTMRVTDTETGVVREYFNPLGRPAETITDTAAFATCPPE